MTDHFLHNDDAPQPDEIASESLEPLVQYCSDLEKDLDTELPAIQARAWERFRQEQVGSANATYNATTQPDPRVRRRAPPGQWADELAGGVSEPSWPKSLDERAFSWLIKSYHHLLREKLSASTPSAEDDRIDEALVLTWERLWRDRSGWPVGQEGVEKLFGAAMAALDDRLARGRIPQLPEVELEPELLPPGPLSPNPHVGSGLLPEEETLCLPFDETPNGQVSRLGSKGEIRKREESLSRRIALSAVMRSPSLPLNDHAPTKIHS